MPKTAVKRRLHTREMPAYDGDQAGSPGGEPQSAPTPSVAMPDEDTLAILSEDGLAALKQGYNAQVFASLAKGMIRYPKLDGEVEWIGDNLYRTQVRPSTGYSTAEAASADAVRTTLNATEREMVVLAVAVAKRDLFTMAGHIYWALMETKHNPVERVADALITAGTYCGVDSTRWAVAVYRKVLAVLRAAVADGFKDTKSLLTLRYPQEFPEY